MKNIKPENQDNYALGKTCTVPKIVLFQLDLGWSKVCTSLKCEQGTNGEISEFSKTDEFGNLVVVYECLDKHN